MDQHRGVGRRPTNSTKRKVVSVNKFLTLIPYTFLTFLNVRDYAALLPKNATLGTEICYTHNRKMLHASAKYAALEIRVCYEIRPD